MKSVTQNLTSQQTCILKHLKCRCLEGQFDTYGAFGFGFVGELLAWIKWIMSPSVNAGHTWHRLCPAKLMCFQELAYADPLPVLPANTCIYSWGRPPLQQKHVVAHLLSFWKEHVQYIFQHCRNDLCPAQQRFRKLIIPPDMTRSKLPWQDQIVYSVWYRCL